jgi:hypothetical protein
MNGKGNKWFLNQMRACLFLAPVTFEPVEVAGWTLVYICVNSQVLYPPGRKFSFFSNLL